MLALIFRRWSKPMTANSIPKPHNEPTPINKRKTKIDYSPEALFGKGFDSNPGDAMPETENETPQHDKFTTLAVDDIRVYEHNPRTLLNEQYGAIKEGLAAEGLGKVLFYVVKRPGEKHYTQSFGGGTRLNAIKELWQETGDKRFKTVRCVIQPYVDELEMRVDHFIENALRNDLCFWDTAVSAVNIYREAEAENGSPMSPNAFVELIKKRGMSIQPAAFYLYMFAVLSFGRYSFRVSLSRNIIRDLKPRWVAYERLAEVFGKPGLEDRIHLGLAAYDSQVGTKVRFDGDAILRVATNAACMHLQWTQAALNRAVEYMGRNPKADAQAIQAQVSSVLTTAQDASGPYEPSRNVAKPDSAASMEANFERLRAQLEQPGNEDGHAPRKPTVVDPDPERRLMPYTPRTVLRQIVAMGINDADPYALVRQLVRFICDNSNLRNMVVDWDQGVGFYLEPYAPPDWAQPNPSPTTLYGAHAFNFLAGITGQFLPEVIERMPADSLWRRAMLEQDPKLSAVKSAIARLPHAAISQAYMLFGDNAWGTLQYVYCLRTNTEMAPMELLSDARIALVAAAQNIARMYPKNFTHIVAPDAAQDRRNDEDWT
jgi:hypothetical protein